MKFYSGQRVTVLDTEYKPAGNAIVCKYEENSDKYEVEFKYPDSDATNNILLPEERLILPVDFLNT